MVQKVIAYLKVIAITELLLLLKDSALLTVRNIQ